MAHAGAQNFLQAGLSAGMSATTGLNSESKPPPVDSSFDGMAHVLPDSFTNENNSRITLRGKHHNVEVSHLCIGAWPWGDTGTWHWADEERPKVTEAWQTCVENGVNYIDTAQVYGSGESERICGELVANLPRDSYVMQTKWFMAPWSPTNIVHPVDAPYHQLKDSLKRTGLKQMDVYLVHGHIHYQSISQVAKGLARCVDEGLTKCVGVANYSTEDMLQMRDELAKYDIPLAINQCEFNVLRRHPETHGLLEACKKNGIQFQSYSSLAQGRLSGKYTPDNEAPKTYRFSNYPMKELQPTLKVLDDIAKSRGKSMAAVALNYNMSKGVNPVAAVRSADQARQNCQALGWRLTHDEIRRIDAVSFDGKETTMWQQG